MEEIERERGWRDRRHIVRTTGTRKIIERYNFSSRQLDIERVRKRRQRKR